VEEVVNSADATPFSLAQIEGIESTEDLFGPQSVFSKLNLDLGDLSIGDQGAAGKSLFSVEEIPEEYVANVFAGYPFESAALLNQDSIDTYKIEEPEPFESINEESIETYVDLEPSDNSQCNESVSSIEPSPSSSYHYLHIRLSSSSSSFCIRNQKPKTPFKHDQKKKKKKKTAMAKQFLPTT
jgi:hypothetical protein